MKDVKERLWTADEHGAFSDGSSLRAFWFGVEFPVV